ncbi:hypothetical protein ACKI1H_14630 [Pseudomonas sp. YH-1]|uniref:hypothetical protein n=1 Tax=Pseudomonas sp. YH-1 TaxID=3384787 RepID=UPI003F7D9116
MADFKKVVAIANAANDVFLKSYESSCVLVGVSQGLPGPHGCLIDTVTLECTRSGQRILISVDDANNERLHLAVGEKKSGELSFFEETTIDTLSVPVIFSLMEKNFET